MTDLSTLPSTWLPKCVLGAISSAADVLSGAIDRYCKAGTPLFLSNVNHPGPDPRHDLPSNRPMDIFHGRPS